MSDASNLPLLHLLALLLALPLVVLFHEAGHALAARLAGAPVLRLQIGQGRPFLVWGTFALGPWPTGGACTLSRAGWQRLPLRGRILFLLGGPLACLAAAPLLWLLHPLLGVLCMASGLLNLLPVAPLDGGRAAWEIAQARRPRPWSVYRRARRRGRWLAPLLSALLTIPLLGFLP